MTRAYCRSILGKRRRIVKKAAEKNKGLKGESLAVNKSRRRERGKWERPDAKMSPLATFGVLYGMGVNGSD